MKKSAGQKFDGQGAMIFLISIEIIYIYIVPFVFEALQNTLSVHPSAKQRWKNVNISSYRLIDVLIKPQMWLEKGLGCVHLVPNFALELLAFFWGSDLPMSPCVAFPNCIFVGHFRIFLLDFRSNIHHTSPCVNSKCQLNWQLYKYRNINHPWYSTWQGVLVSCFTKLHAFAKMSTLD